MQWIEENVNRLKKKRIAARKAAADKITADRIAAIEAHASRMSVPANAERYRRLKLAALEDLAEKSSEKAVETTASNVDEAMVRFNAHWNGGIQTHPKGWTQRANPYYR